MKEHRHKVADMSEKSEEIRLRYFYRRLIAEKKLGLSFEGARGLVGPDCAYHLYATIDLRKNRRRSRKIRTRR